MMNRRNFLRSVILGSSTILVGEDVLNWKRKYFPGVNFSQHGFVGRNVYGPVEIDQILRQTYSIMRTSYFPNITPLVKNTPMERFGGKNLYFNIDMKPPKINWSEYLYAGSKS